MPKIEKLLNEQTDAFLQLPAALYSRFFSYCTPMKIKTEIGHEKTDPEKTVLKKMAEPLDGSNMALADKSNCHTLLLKNEIR
jgi:hypothetical protein